MTQIPSYPPAVFPLTGDEAFPIWQQGRQVTGPFSALQNQISQNAVALSIVATSALAQNAAASASQAAISALQASGAMANVGILSTYPSALPYRVTAIAGGVGTGSGGTPGEYALGVTGGPLGHKAYVTIGSDGKIASYRNANGGLSTSSTAPTYSLSGVTGLTGATAPTATVGTILVGETFYSPSSDGSQRLTWQNSAGALAAFTVGGAQEAIYYKALLDAATGQILLISNMFTRGGYYNTSGVFTTDANWGTTPLLELAYLNVSRLKLYGHTSVRTINFYDKRQNYISSVVAGSIGTYITSLGTVPGNAFYATFTYYVPDLNNQAFAMHARPVSPWRSDLTLPLDMSVLATMAGYILASSGAFVADALWISTDFLKVNAGDIISFTMWGNPVVASVAFYDANRVLISPATAASSIGGWTSTATAPSNAAYYRLSMGKPGSGGGNPVPAGYVNFAMYTLQVDAWLKAQMVSPQQVNLAMSLDMTTLATYLGYLNSSTGVFVSDTHWQTTDFLTVKPGETINFTMWGHQSVASVAWYDSTRTLITPTVAASAVGGWTSTATAPSNAAYYRLSMGKPGSGGGQPVPSNYINTAIYVLQVNSYLQGLLASPVAATVFNIPVFRRPRAVKPTGATNIVRYGDSRSSTDYPFIATNLASLTGATVVAGGISGTTVAQQASNANLSALFARNPDVCIFLPGGNDTGAAGTVGSFSGVIPGEPTVAQSDITVAYAGSYFIQAVDYIIRRWKAQYYNIRTRAGLTGSETETQKNNMIRAVPKPMLIVCTDLPQQRNNSSDPTALPANWTRKRQAIIEACYRNGVHCADTMQMLNFDMSVEPYYTSPTQTNNNQGVWYMDGLHLNEFGDMLTMQIVCSDAGLV